jgi:uncharacterized membrane protein
VITPASVHKHPIHPMLVVFPIGLWVFSFVCDVVYVTVGGPLWSGAAMLAIVGGIIGALAAAIPGLIDFWSLSSSAFRTALTHLALNALALTVFIVSAFSRWVGAQYSISMTLSAIGIVALVFSGWLGGELVYVRGVAVEVPSGTSPRG